MEGATKLYHSKIYIPVELKIPLGKLYVRYSDHALNEAERERKFRRLKNIFLHKNIYVESENVVEIEVNNNVVIKVLYRIPYDDNYDLLLAVNFPNGLVKTVWLNSIHDNHESLNKEKYESPRNL